jgi:hypothetical protein
VFMTGQEDIEITCQVVQGVYTTKPSHSLILIWMLRATGSVG